MKTISQIFEEKMEDSKGDKSTINVGHQGSCAQGRLYGQASQRRQVDGLR